MPNHTRALVLSGGGARGAYEAGVLGYIWRNLGPHFTKHPSFQILCGTSVGAINTVSLAATAHEPLTQGDVLMNQWRSLHGNKLLKVSGSSLFRFARWMVGSILPGLARYLAVEQGSLLETGPLVEFVRGAIHWPQIQKNVHAGRLAAVSISCTELSSGLTRVFLATRRRQLPEWSRDTMVQAERCVLRPEHVLASASIPILFPAVPIRGVYYCDGGLRQNTPLSPAMRLGADRVMVIGLRGSERFRSPRRGEPYPTPMFLAGKVIDAMLLDRIDYDIDRLRMLNELLENGERAFGNEFSARVNEAVVRWRLAPYQKVKCLYIRPTRDLGEVALECVKSGELEATGLTRRLIHRVATGESEHAADLMSYLLFDRPFAERLIRLGFEDAHNRREEILDFFDDRDVGGEAPELDSQQLTMES